MPLVFDPTGFLPANKINNEVHTVTFAGETNPYLIVPVQAPFYKEGFSIVDENGVTLQEGVHYHFTHVWQDAIGVIGKQIFGSIALVGITASGDYRVNYQAVGGDYPSGNAYAVEGFSGLTLNDLFLLDWENVPATWPQTVHTHPLLSGFEGMQQVFEKLDAIAQALNNSKTIIHLEDVEDFDEAFITPVVDTLNEIIGVISGTTLDMTEINNINAKLQTLIPWANVDPGLDFYEIPVAKFFKLKVGKIVYDPTLPVNSAGGRPTVINFPTPFPNQCLFGTIRVGTTEGTYAQEHLVEHSVPNKNRFNTVRIEQIDTDYPNESRTITYFALGL